MKQKSLEIITTAKVWMVMSNVVQM